MKLTSEQIDRIKQKIKLRRIYYLDIQAELTDHIACKIENELQKEEDFEDLLHNTLKEFDLGKFQRQLLMQAHTNSFREFLGNFGNLSVLVKTLAITFLIGNFINLFSKNTPEFAETVLKTSFLIACYSGFILGL